MFVLRGPLRGITWAGDLAAPLAGARAWAAGENPYDAGALSRILLEIGGERVEDGRPYQTPAVYPPSAFVVLAPLTVFPWPLARALWMALSLGLFAVHLGLLLRMAAVRADETGGMLLAGGILLLAPWHTGLALGQLAVPVAALIVIAVARIDRAGPMGTGALIGVATALKPQITVPFLVYFLFRRRRPALFALLLACLTAATGIAWLRIHDMAWMEAWRGNLMAELVGGWSDPAGRDSHAFVDVGPLLAALPGPDTPRWLAFGLGAAVAGILSRRLTRHEPSDDLLAASAVAVWMLLFFGYHRFYDAAVLSLPLAWAAKAFRLGGEQKAVALAALVCCAAFFLPGATALHALAGRGALPGWLTGSVIWDVGILRHQIWALVALQILLLTALGPRRSVNVRPGIQR